MAWSTSRSLARYLQSSGKAIFDGPEHRVHVRIAEQDGVIYLDLCNERWETIAVDHDGWQIVANPPIKFRRTRDRDG